uniref:NADH-ubiquinone oxidoreductase chain 5 n=1 Tax=Olivierus martensii TaxID=34649 RepID=A7RAB8_OLIMR|nr:NADH dehydrogenase subunit 5 [Mesobuthus martensii]ABC71913.1 NADH dehydrogenase subunit 5 [Mesobuthus martensii]
MWSKTLLGLSLLTFYLSFQSFKENTSFLLSYSLSNLSTTNLEFLLILDWISLTFTSTVLFISSMVLFFSDEYMIEEKNKNRFILLLLFFVLSMLLFILSPNLMSLLLGWDGLGLVSYCLVIYYQNPRSLNAGLLTILSNRIGDVMILMAIALSLSFGSWDILSMNLIHNSPFIFFFILLAAMTKSAQIPFSAWLPAAMAAPTPISALVHSSTLVTAGVYLLIRFQNMFPKSLSTFLLISASLTMFMAGLSATMETDLKKIIALSTLSQLAIMMLALALHFWKLAYFHMITHAMFKALMFLCAGFIIHNTKNNQDIRKMGALLLSAPTISTCLMISSITLMGLPFTSGFFSKDLILESLLTSQLNQIISSLILFSFGLTMLYSFRLAFSSLWASNINHKNSFIHEKMEMTLPISFLTLLALTLGAILNWTLSTPIFSLPPLMKSTGCSLILLGVITGFILWIYPSPLNNPKQNLLFLTNMWYLPTLSPKPFLMLLPFFSLLKTFEFGWSEKIGPQGIHFSTSIPAQSLSLTQKNSPLFILTTALITLLLLFLF